MYTINTVGIPRFRHLEWTEEHLVQTQGIRTVLSHCIIWVHDIEHRFGHLLNRPTANVLLWSHWRADIWIILYGSAVCKDKLRILELRHPVTEGIDIQNVVLDDIHVYVDRLNFIFVLWVVDEVVADKEVARCAFADIAINEVRTTLDHTLVDEFGEWFVLADIAKVEEELVPETAIDEVNRCMLGTTDLEGDLTPVVVGLFAYKCCIVVVVHIAEVVRRRTRETRHGAELEWEDIDIINQ